MVCFKVWEKTHYKFLYQSSSGIRFSCLPKSDRDMDIDKGFGYHIITDTECVIFLSHLLIYQWR